MKIHQSKAMAFLVLVLTTIFLSACGQSIEILEVREADPSLFDNIDSNGNLVLK